jgi:hypothetical protein
MKRYSNVSVSERWDGKKVLNTTHYPDIPQLDSDIYIVTNDSDYLDTLAFKYYHDPTLFWIIALANNLGKGRMSVPGGIQIRIPTNKESIISEYDRLNS